MVLFAEIYGEDMASLYEQSEKMAAILRQLRVNCKLSQSELLAGLQKTGLDLNSSSVISEWENGKKVPDISVLEAYSRYFNADMRWLSGQIGEFNEFIPRSMEFDTGDEEIDYIAQRLRDKDSRRFNDWKDIGALLLTNATGETEHIGVSSTDSELLAILASNMETVREAIENLLKKRGIS